MNKKDGLMLGPLTNGGTKVKKLKPSSHGEARRLAGLSWVITEKQSRTDKKC